MAGYCDCGRDLEIAKVFGHYEGCPQRALAENRAEVDEAMVERACEAYWNDAGGDGPHPNPWPDGADPFAEDIRKGMRAALKAVIK